MERCGMRREAYCRKNVRYIKNGQERWEDELSYAILWEDRKSDKEDRKWKR
jgi:RimJ/RimL family protein N-acetyltransferase